MKGYYVVIAVTLLLFSCEKQYSGYCISGSGPGNYQVLEFVEEAATKNQAEQKVEKMLNETFPTNGKWSCEVDD